VTDVDTDEASLVTKLTAVAAPWQNITGTFEMDFGKVVLRPAAAARLRDRGWSDFWNGVKDGVDNAVDTVIDGAKDVADKAKDAAKEAVGAVGGAVSDAVDAVKDAAGTVADDVKDKAGEALDEAAKIGKEIEAIFNNGGEGELSGAIEFDVSGGEQGVVKNIFTDPFK
jgi:phage-related protein